MLTNHLVETCLHFEMFAFLLACLFSFFFLCQHPACSEVAPEDEEREKESDEVGEVE